MRKAQISNEYIIPCSLESRSSTWKHYVSSRMVSSI